MIIINKGTMHVWGKKTFGTYKLSFIPLDDVFVLPLVLLHPQLSVLHFNIVCQVKHCIKETHTSIKG